MRASRSNARAHAPGLAGDSPLLGTSRPTAHRVTRMASSLAGIGSVAAAAVVPAMLAFIAGALVRLGGTAPPTRAAAAVQPTRWPIPQGIIVASIRRGPRQDTTLLRQILDDAAQRVEIDLADYPKRRSRCSIPPAQRCIAEHERASIFRRAMTTA